MESVEHIDALLAEGLIRQDVSRINGGSYDVTIYPTTGVDIIDEHFAPGTSKGYANLDKARVMAFEALEDTFWFRAALISTIRAKLFPTDSKGL